MIEKEWEYRGYQLMVEAMQNRRIRSGYVTVPRCHPAYGAKDLGGITYSEKQDDGQWRFGFDGLLTLNEASDECELLANQLYDMEKAVYHSGDKQGR